MTTRTTAAAVAGWSADPFVPDSRSLSRLGRAAGQCRGCPLWEPATQTVFGDRRPIGGDHAGRRATR